MKIRLLTLLLILAGFSASYAQKLVTIHDIQFVKDSALKNCIDSSSYKGKQIKVRGVVVMAGSLSRASANVRNIWIQDGSGAWTGLDIFNGATATKPVDVLDLVAGDSIEVVASLDEYQGETELINVQSLKLLASGRTVHSTKVNLSDINDASNINKLPTGEQWEGSFIELNNVTVATVDPFSGGSRVSFHVTDAAGNKINVSDRFIAQRLAANGGSFVTPNVGDVFKSLRGIIDHSENGCPGTNGRGYELYPFDVTHYDYGVAAPAISNITRDYASPNPSQAVTVSATITSDSGIKTATLYYAVGMNASKYTAVAMSVVSGNTYAGKIPAQVDGSFVSYYITATDKSKKALTSYNPSTQLGTPPLFYRVRANGLDIYDIQFTPYADGNSAFANQSVTVSGVVTAETKDLQYLYIQEPNQLAWAGLAVSAAGNVQLTTLKRGDKVTLTGTIKELNGFTTMTSVTQAVKDTTGGGKGKITPLVIDPNSFTKYSFANTEAFEGMLICLKPDTGKLKIVALNADSTSATSKSNFGEYRVGSNIYDPFTGCRVLDGVVNSSGPTASLNVSYINDSKWASNVLVSPTQVLKVGNYMDSLVGIMYYSFSNMKLLPRDNKDFYNLNVAVKTISIHGATQIQNNINMFPNPTPGQMNIEVKGTDVNAAHTLTVYDLNGRVVFVHNMPANTSLSSFELNLVPGCYITKFSNLSNGEVAQSKLLIYR